MNKNNRTNDKNEHPIFVMGTPRSGTTLVAKILNRHSKIFMPGETHFFEDIYSREKVLGDPENSESINNIIQRLSTLYSRYNEPEDQKNVEELIFNNEKTIKKIQKECKTYRDILTLFMDIQTKNAQKCRWGNNTPRDIFEVEKILEFYPEAKIIICVRDIRDFLLSYKKRWRVVPPEHRRRLKVIYHPVIVSMLWRSAVKRIKEIQKKVNNNNFIVIRYEALVENPEEIVSKICDTIEESYEPCMLNTDFCNSSTNFEEKGIFKSSIGKWKGSLPNEEVFVAQIIASTLLKEFGYNIYKLKYSKVEVIKIICSAPIALIRGIYVTKDFYGPAIPYILKRLRYGLR